MKRKYYLLFFLAIIASVFSLRCGNSTLGFKAVELLLYPEYDDSRLLVIITGDMDGVTAPATVRFLVPSAAQMYSAGSIDDEGVYSGGPPDRKPSSLEGWDEISYEVTSDTFRVEYYDPIIIGETDKTISYEFYSLYPISDLTVYLQEPLSSSNYSVSPPSYDIFNATDFFSEVEFKFHRYYYSGLDVDDPISFEIAYTKSEPNPSLMITD